MQNETDHWGLHWKDQTKIDQNMEYKDLISEIYK